MDYICCIMPEDEERFLRVISVMQDYQLNLIVGAKSQNPLQPITREPFQITFRMNEKFRYFEPVLRVVQDNVPIFDYSGWNECQRGEFDCYIVFDDNLFHRAAKIALTVNANIVQGINSILGSGAAELPVLRALDIKTNPADECDVLILNWDPVESEKLYEYIFNNYPQLDIICDGQDFSKYPLQDIIQYISHFKCVIGEASKITFIAAALKKVVLEHYSSTELGNLHSVGGPGCVAIAGSKMTAHYAWLVWEEKLWPALSLNMSSRVEQASMALPPSTVDAVEEKSGDSSILKQEQ